MRNKCVIVKDENITIGEPVVAVSSTEVDEPTIHIAIQTLLRAKREDVRGATAYFTHIPCFSCCQALVVAGVKKVIYKKERKDSTASEQLLAENGIKLICNPDLND